MATRREKVEEMLKIVESYEHPDNVRGFDEMRVRFDAKDETQKSQAIAAGTPSRYSFDQFEDDPRGYVEALLAECKANGS